MIDTQNIENDPYAMVAVGSATKESLEEIEFQKLQALEQAVRIQETVDTEGWADIVKHLEEFKKRHSQTPDVYSDDPTGKLVHIHTGVHYTIDYILKYIQNCKSLINKAEYEARNRTNEAGGIGESDQPGA